MNDVTKELLEALKYAAGCLGTDGNDPIDDIIVRAEAALADAKNDSYRLDAIEARAKESGTGVSFDWCRHVEDGMVVEHGYRMMWKHTIGPREKSVRHAIDAAMGWKRPQGSAE